MHLNAMRGGSAKRASRCLLKVFVFLRVDLVSQENRLARTDGKSDPMRAVEAENMSRKNHLGYGGGRRLFHSTGNKNNDLAIRQKTDPSQAETNAGCTSHSLTRRPGVFSLPEISRD